MQGKEDAHRRYVQDANAWLRVSPDAIQNLSKHFRTFWALPAQGSETPAEEQAMAFWLTSVFQCCSHPEFISFLKGNTLPLSESVSPSSDQDCGSEEFRFLGLVWQGLHILGYGTRPFDDIEANTVTVTTIVSLAEQLKKRMNVLSMGYNLDALRVSPAALTVLYWMLKELPVKCRQAGSCSRAAVAPAAHAPPVLPTAVPRGGLPRSPLSKGSLGDRVKQLKLTMKGVFAFCMDENCRDVEKFYGSRAVGNYVREHVPVTNLEQMQLSFVQNAQQILDLIRRVTAVKSPFILVLSNHTTRRNPYFSVDFETGKGSNMLGLYIMEAKKKKALLERVKALSRLKGEDYELYIMEAMKKSDQELLERVKALRQLTREDYEQWLQQNRAAWERVKQRMGG